MVGPRDRKRDSNLDTGVTESAALRGAALRADVLIFLHDHSPGHNIDGSIDPQHWPTGLELFIRQLLKRELSVVVIGPRPKLKNPLGHKRHLRFLDRHDVIFYKVLEGAKSQAIEVQVLGRKLKNWIRIRVSACIVNSWLGNWTCVGAGQNPPHDVNLLSVPGFFHRGLMSLHALQRMIQEWLPEDSAKTPVPFAARKFLILGSRNQEIIMGLKLLSLGAQCVEIAESSGFISGWRALQEQFIAKGGRFFKNHSLSKVVEVTPELNRYYLKEETGTGGNERLIIEADTLIVSPSSPLNQSHLNAPEFWQKGLFYVQSLVGSDPESRWLTDLDWAETQWRLLRLLDKEDYAITNGSIERIRTDRKKLREVKLRKREWHYNGKNLSFQSVQELIAEKCSPPEIPVNAPLASLECFEETPCQECVIACPEAAISKHSALDLPRLNPTRCTGCGVCVAVCPAQAAFMLRGESVDGKEDHYRRITMGVTLADGEFKENPMKQNESVSLRNRRGEIMGAGKVLDVRRIQGTRNILVDVQVPNYLTWDVRSIRRKAPSPLYDDLTMTPLGLKVAQKGFQVESGKNIEQGWVFINGMRRLSKLRIPIRVALAQMGYRRYQDAFFCRTADCGLCTVRKNGELVQSCSTTLMENDEILVTLNSPLPSECVGCVCSGRSCEEIQSLEKVGLSVMSIAELTGAFQGACRGRWCLGQGTKPNWFGYYISPWALLSSQSLKLNLK